jgi:WD40 repeat protein
MTNTSFRKLWASVAWSLAVFFGACHFSGCEHATTSISQKPLHSAAQANSTAATESNTTETKTDVAIPSEAIKADSEVSAPEQPKEQATETLVVATPPNTTPEAIVTKAPEPTADQLARWKQPEFEPLVLLARHQSDEISFVSHSVRSPDGQWLVLGGEKLTLWKPLAEQPVATLWNLKVSEKSESIKSLAIDPTGKWIAAGDAEGTLRLWSLSDQKELVSKKVLRNDVVHLSISDDGNEIAVGSYGKEILVLDAKTLEQKKKFSADNIGRDNLMYVGPGKIAVAGQALTIWDTTTGTLSKTLAEKGYVASLTRSADRALFAYAQESILSFLNSKDLSVSKEVKGNFARDEILQLTNDGEFLWTANGSYIRGWDLSLSQPVQYIDVKKPEVVGLDWLDDRKLLRVITEDGAIRYWGTTANGQAVGLKPLHAPITIPEGQNLPATAFELFAMMDLRTLPKPPDSIATSGEATMLQCDSGNSIDDTKAFYRHVFAMRGWKEEPGNVATPDYLNFTKNGFKVFLSISDSGAGRRSIYMTSLGNLDLRTVPKAELPGFKVTYESDSTVHYEVATDLLTIETELLKKLSASGWIPYSRLNASHNEEIDQRHFEFIRNAISLRVSVQPKVDDPSRYVVQYSAFLAPGHLPVPEDCDFIECDVVRSAALVVKTSMALDNCHAFYEKAMSKLGWLALRAVKSKEDDIHWLTFYRDQTEVNIRLTKAKEGGTWVVVGEYAQGNTWQLAKKEESKSEGKKPNTSGIQASDIPIFKQSETTSVNYDKQQKRIEIKLPKNSHVEILDFYAAKLSPLGWKEEPNGFRDEDYGFVTFTKDKVEVAVRVNSNSLGTTVGISEDGLLWDKPPIEAKVLISYEGWMRKNGRTASLKMLDEYTQEMRSLVAK